MASTHTDAGFEKELQDLRRLISEMGGHCEFLLANAIKALTTHDVGLAQTVIARDAVLDEMQRTLEELAVNVLMRRQPMAVDLREVVSAMRLAGDLERIGDLAKNIAKRSLEATPQVISARVLGGLQAMGRLAQIQLKDVLDAYAALDAKAAMEVWARDAEIDALETSLFREFLTYMMEDPRNISVFTHLLFCVKNIERVGDHATNIAETVHYLVVGGQLPIDRPKGPSPIPVAEAGAATV